MRTQELGRDAAQETFLKAFKSLKQYRKQSSFRAWLFTIARNQCIDFIRKNKRRSAESLDENYTENALENSNSEKRIEAKDLARKILNKLSDKDREVVLLREAYGMGYEEISGITKSSLDSVKARLKRARAQMLEIAKELEKTLEDDTI